MTHPTIQKYIGELKTAKFPYFTSDTQVVCGRVTLFIGAKRTMKR